MERLEPVAPVAQAGQTVAMALQARQEPVAVLALREYRVLRGYRVLPAPQEAMGRPEAAVHPAMERAGRQG